MSFLNNMKKLIACFYASSNTLSSKYVKVTFTFSLFNDSTFDAPKGNTVGKII